MKLDHFQKIFQSSFDDSPRWRSWFFDRVVCNEDEIMLGEDAAGNVVSALLMQPYDFEYQGEIIPLGYISCVATLPRARSGGAASRLLCDAVKEARERGYALCALIPAHPRLAYFYKRFGFVTVFYIDRRNYTALHNFGPVRQELVEPSAALMARLEQKIGCSVVHNAAKYQEIIEDMAIDGKHEVLAVDGDCGAGILFAVDTDDEVRVKSLVAEDVIVEDSLLAHLRERRPDKAYIVDGPPVSGEKAFLTPFGMGRVCNAQILFNVMARKYPKLNILVRLTDGLLPANSGVYEIANGKCLHHSSIDRRPDLDVSADTLTSILFSSRGTGDIFGLPTQRAYMSLMLDS